MCSLASWSHQKFSQDIERAQKRCKMLLYPALSYNQTLIKSGLERLDFRHDVNVIAQKMFQEIKDTNIPCIICCHLLKCLIIIWFYGSHIQAKVPVVDEILFRIAHQRSFNCFRLCLVLLV